MTGRLLRNCLNTRREFASPFHLLKRCCVEQVQFCIAKVFDGLTKVLGQDMPWGCGFGWRFCGRVSPWRRRSISNCCSREEVRRRLLSTFPCHSRIMAQEWRAATCFT